MGKTIGAANTIQRMRNKALAVLLPDTCNIYAPERHRTTTGTYQEYHVIQEYNDSTTIPCRLDIARFFRSGNVEAQSITVNDYEIHLPYDFEIHGDWRIDIHNELYEVRKDMGSATNTITKILLITRLDKIKNPIVAPP